MARELLIGANPSGPEYEFAGIWLTAVTGSGSIFVSDGAQGRIRKFDGSGRYRGEIGRIGSGPGEYRDIVGMATDGDSLLAVFDRANGRVALFDTAGAYRRSFRVSGGGFLPSRAFASFSDGLVAVRSRVTTPPPTADGVSSVFVRYRLNGEIVDSIRVPPEDVRGMVMVTRDLGPRWVFPDAAVFALLPGGGIATARTTAYRINVARPRTPTFVMERAAEPVPLEGEERDEWQALMRFVAGGSSGSDIPVIPRRKPIIRELFADVEGRIWVSLYTQASRRDVAASETAERRPSLTWEEHNAYDLFDGSGRYLGRVDLRPSSRMLAVRGDRVWVSEVTEQGEIVVVRYRMRMPQA